MSTKDKPEGVTDDAVDILARTLRALRDCSALLQAETSREGRSYKVDGRIITVGQALDEANAVLGRFLPQEAKK